MIRVGVHEDRLPRAAGGQVCDRRLGLHVLDGVHADAQMRQQCLRQSFADFVVDRRCTWWHTVASAIPAQRAEERAVRRAGVGAMQTVDDMQAIFVWLKRTDRLGQRDLGQRSTVLQSLGNACIGMEPLVLHEEHDSLARRVGG